MTEKACLFVLPRVHRCLTAVLLLLLVLGSGPEVLYTLFAGRHSSAPSHPGVKTAPHKGTMGAIVYAGAQKAWAETSTTTEESSSLSTTSGPPAGPRRAPRSVSAPATKKDPFYKKYGKQALGAVILALAAVAAAIYYFKGKEEEPPPDDAGGRGAGGGAGAGGGPGGGAGGGAGGGGGPGGGGPFQR